MSEEFSLQSFYTNNDFMTEGKRCKTCDSIYRTIDAIGKLQCRYHPDPYPSGNSFIHYNDEVSRYSCCGQPVNPRDKGYKRELRYGCTPADHTIMDRSYIEGDGLQIVMKPIDMPKQTIITYNIRDCRYTIWRFDYIQANYRLQYGTYDATVDSRLKALQKNVLCMDDEDSESDFSFSDVEEEEDSTDADNDDEGSDESDIPLFVDDDDEEVDIDIDRDFEF